LDALSVAPIIIGRYHTVQEFNKGVYEYIIATDESGAHGEQDSDGEAENMEPSDLEDECPPSPNVTSIHPLTRYPNSNINSTRRSGDSRKSRKPR
jgi:ATP-dependent RNA helicase DDX56/DBP9